MADRFFDDPDVEETERPENVLPAPLPLRILGYTIKTIFWLLILGVNVILFWRMFSTGFPREMKVIDADAALRSAYSAYTAEDNHAYPFAVYQKYCLKHCLTVDDPVEDAEGNLVRLGNYGYFSMEDQIIFPTAGQAQLVFRYNLSTLEHLQEDYQLPEVPSKYGEYFTVTLRVLTDGGDDSSGAVQTTVLPSRTVNSAEKKVYCYRQLAFDGIPALDTVREIIADIQYVDAPEGTEPYGSIAIYQRTNPTTEYKLDKQDRAALTGE